MSMRGKESRFYSLLIWLIVYWSLRWVIGRDVGFKGRRFGIRLLNSVDGGWTVFRLFFFRRGEGDVDGFTGVEVKSS